MTTRTLARFVYSTIQANVKPNNFAPALRLYSTPAPAGEKHSRKYSMSIATVNTLTLRQFLVELAQSHSYFDYKTHVWLQLFSIMHSLLIFLFTYQHAFFYLPITKILVVILPKTWLIINQELFNNSSFFPSCTIYRYASKNVFIQKLNFLCKYDIPSF